MLVVHTALSSLLLHIALLYVELLYALSSIHPPSYTLKILLQIRMQINIKFSL